MPRENQMPEVSSVTEETPRRRKRLTESMEAAKHLGELTVDERAYCVRLVRIMREPNHWMGFFIQWMLRKEAGVETLSQVTPKDVQSKLEDIVKLLSWADTIKTWKKEAPELAEIYGRRFWPDRVDAVAHGNVNELLHNQEFSEFAHLIWPTLIV